MSIRSLPERKGVAAPPGAGGTQQRFDRVRSTLKFKAILVDLQNLVRKGILPEKKMVPFHIPTLGKLHAFCMSSDQ